VAVGSAGLLPLDLLNLQQDRNVVRSFGFMSFWVN